MEEHFKRLEADVLKQEVEQMNLNRLTDLRESQIRDIEKYLTYFVKALFYSSPLTWSTSDFYRYSNK